MAELRYNWNPPETHSWSRNTLPFYSNLFSNSTKLDVSNILSTHSAIFCQIWRSLEYSQLQLKSELDDGHVICYVNPRSPKNSLVLGLSDRMAQISGCLLGKTIFVPIALLWTGDNVVPSYTSAVGKISPSVLIKQLSPAVLSTLEKPWRAE